MEKRESKNEELWVFKWLAEGGQMKNKRQEAREGEEGGAVLRLVDWLVLGIEPTDT